MNETRRIFFRKVGVFVAAPVVGLAKVLCATPKPPALEPFRNGDVLTAESLNNKFRRLDERIDGIV